jgi:carboxymethylenebutenolidase
MPPTRIPGAATAAELDGYLAVPPVGAGPWPGVVVVHEVFGLNDDTRQQADRLAAAGYLAVAPNLFTAGGALRCMRSTFSSLMRAEGPPFEDLEAARSWLAARPDCTGRVGIVGFCMGGGFALLAAPRGFDVAAPNYGPLPRADLEKVLPGAAAKVERVLTDLGVEHDVKEYPEAGHSFLNRHNTGPFGVLEKVAGLAYHHPSAEDAWGRILRFFDRHLRPAAS